jgi:hypothetical protein
MGVIALIALTAGAFTCQTVKLVRQETPDQPDSTTSSFGKSRLETFEYMHDPHVILLLDVSASMRTTDAGHLQTEAALSFFELYTKLCRETSEFGDTAKIAVVLFAAVPQIVDWTGDQEAWLTATTANQAVFSDAIIRFLGRAGGTDPRLGIKTDYLAAIDAASDLVANGFLTSPPLVLFMTDGKNEIHPMLTTLQNSFHDSGDTLSRLEYHRRLAQKARSGEDRYIDAKDGDIALRTSDVDKWFIRLDLEDYLDEAAIQSAVRKSLDNLLNRTFKVSPSNPSVASYWAPIILGTDQGMVEAARKVLVPENQTNLAYWSGRRDLIQCGTPKELIGEFIGVLTEWLEMRRVTVAQELVVPKYTQVFAVHTEVTDPKARCELVCGGKSVELQGEELHRSAVGEGSGTWKIECQNGEVARTDLYIRPRYQLELYAPDTIDVLGSLKSIAVQLRVVSIADRKYVDGDSVFGEGMLPPVLPAKVIGVPSNEELNFELKRDVDGSETPKPAYAADCPIPSTTDPVLKIVVDQRALRDNGLLIFDAEKTHTISVMPSVRLDVRDASGRKVGGIQAKGLRGFAGYVQKLKELF